MAADALDGFLQHYREPRTICCFSYVKPDRWRLRPKPVFFFLFFQSLMRLPILIFFSVAYEDDENNFFRLVVVMVNLIVLCNLLFVGKARINHRGRNHLDN